ALPIFEPKRSVRRAKADTNRLRRGRVALVGDAADGDEHVGFRKVGGSAAPRNFIRHDDEAAGRARLALEVADEVNNLTRGQALLFHVRRVEEDDAALVKNSAVA